MDKQTDYINGTLFEVFGLCPDYNVVWTDKEWLNFYEPNQDFKWTYYRVNSAPKDTAYPNRAKLHVTEHQTKLVSGVVVSAKFAVHHPSRTIYLQIVDIGGNRVWSMYGK